MAVKSAERVLQIFELLEGAPGGMTNKDISQSLGFAPSRAAPERSGVKGCARQPPPIAARRGFVRGSVRALEAAQRRRHPVPPFKDL